VNPLIRVYEVTGRSSLDDIALAVRKHFERFGWQDEIGLAHLFFFGSCANVDSSWRPRRFMFPACYSPILSKELTR
jgi:hypothetical protein